MTLQQSTRVVVSVVFTNLHRSSNQEPRVQQRHGLSQHTKLMRAEVSSFIVVNWLKILYIVHVPFLFFTAKILSSYWQFYLEMWHLLIKMCPLLRIHWYPFWTCCIYISAWCLRYTIPWRCRFLLLSRNDRMKDSLPSMWKASNMPQKT